jgi:bifunctional pyridoxal-dependent enzyme with beta-cystathionase and maltose regulon repressor activities
VSQVFASFARRRLLWTVDPDQVTVVPDVMAGLVALCRVVAAPGDAVAFATPAYPPFFRELAWLDCTALGLGDEPAAAFVARGRVALGRGLDYGLPGAGHVRLNFATSPAHVSDAVRRMAAALER